MKKYFIASTLLLLCFIAFSQSPPPATPIDGGLGVLLAAGAALGIKKTIKKRFW